MTKDWSKQWSERDQFLKEEWARFAVGLPSPKDMADGELRSELERLNIVFDACRSQEKVRPNQPITAEVRHRIDLVRDEIDSRLRTEDRARGEASLAEDRKSNRLSNIAIVIALFSLALSVCALKK